MDTSLQKQEKRNVLNWLECIEYSGAFYSEINEFLPTIIGDSPGLNDRITGDICSFLATDKYHSVNNVTNRNKVSDLQFMLQEIIIAWGQLDPDTQNFIAEEQDLGKGALEDIFNCVEKNACKLKRSLPTKPEQTESYRVGFLAWQMGYSLRKYNRLVTNYYHSELGQLLLYARSLAGHKKKGRPLGEESVRPYIKKVIEELTSKGWKDGLIPPIPSELCVKDQKPKKAIHKSLVQP